MNKGDRNVRCFSQFKNSYGKVRAEIGFFKPLVVVVVVVVIIITIIFYLY